MVFFIICLIIILSCITIDHYSDDRPICTYLVMILFPHPSFISGIFFVLYSSSSAGIGWSSTQVLPGSMGHIKCRGLPQSPFFVATGTGTRAHAGAIYTTSANALTTSATATLKALHFQIFLHVSYWPFPFL